MQSKSEKKQAAKDVTSRLTDTSKYTGTHKNRFDETGKGKGVLGRKDVVKDDGSTSSSARDHTVNKIEKAEGTAAPPKASSKDKIEKFGVQGAKPISIMLYRNGDKNHSGEKLLLKNFKTMDQLLLNASNTVRLTTGPVKKVYKTDLKTVVKHLEDFEDGGSYLCCSGEPPAASDRLPAAFKPSE